MVDFVYTISHMFLICIESNPSQVALPVTLIWKTGLSARPACYDSSAFCDNWRLYLG